MEQYPRVLIISNDCLSNVTSNGRTLQNFFRGWPMERLAQFHIQSVMPDYSICRNHYYVSDGAALKAFFKRKPVRCNHRLTVGTGTSKGRIRRHAGTMLVRDLVWNSMYWAGDEFFRWVENFSPEVILIQAGDCGFMLRLARKLAEKYDVPLVIYNGEAYYFKQYDYFRTKGIKKWLYPLFYRYFCREFEKTIRQAACSIYNCDKLKDAYDAVFSLPSEVLYTATQMEESDIQESNVPIRISYLGNLGVGRHESLIQIGQALNDLGADLKLDVYGKFPSAEAETELKNCAGIRYCGFVPYETVVEVMHSSDILVHAESFDPFYREDCKFAFSTKIADSLANGKCFLLYAPEGMACTEYLQSNDAAYVVSEPEKLIPVLRSICFDEKMRNQYTCKARKLAELNHREEKSVAVFRRIMCAATNGEYTYGKNTDGYRGIV